MEKVLRSRILERFPFELRVELELLSRRRDIKESRQKQHMIFQLLRKYKIGDIVPLGSGTNRYAFKMDGYVIKVATDRDGKIDNLKEFKMAKRLYPHVIRVHEVSENGTLLVAEYIQPFSSYAEMIEHADEIREILKELSSVYLIGDVGISSDNWANWGMRVGYDKPVCLDFAYVYNVSSELFLCRNCNSGSILVPNSDFTELYCPAPNCGKRYRFETIRQQIGNELHRQEIGDLSEEGYKLTESGLPIDLTPGRSQYIKPERSKEEVVSTHQYDDDNEEVTQMNVRELARLISQAKEEEIVRATATAVDDDYHDRAAIKVQAQVVEPDGTGEAFSGAMDDEDIIHIVAKIANDTETEAGEVAEGSTKKDEDDSGTVDIPASVTGTALAFEGGDEEVVSSVVSTPADTSDDSEEDSEGEETEEMVEGDSDDEGMSDEDETSDQDLNDEALQVAMGYHFQKNINQQRISTNVSNLANRIGGSFQEIDLFNSVKELISDKRMTQDTFYMKLQNAVYRSLVAFLDFNEEQYKRQDGSMGRKFIAPANMTKNMDTLVTQVFLDRYWRAPEIRELSEGAAVVDTLKFYDRRYSDAVRGIQSEWLNFFEARMRLKMPGLSPECIDMISTIASTMWCNDREDFAMINSEPTEESVVDKTADPSIMKDNAPIDIGSAHEGEEDGEVEEVVPQESLVQNPHIPPMVFEDRFDHQAEDDEDEEEEDEIPLQIHVLYGKTYDIVQVIYEDEMDRICIPFYTKLNTINLDKESIPSVADDRNGVWDWLTSFGPEYTFITKDPNKWLAQNDNVTDASTMKFVILEDGKDGTYTMGMYIFAGVHIVDENGNMTSGCDDKTMMRLNRLIREDTMYSRISHLAMTLNDESLMVDEEDIEEIIATIDTIGDAMEGKDQDKFFSQEEQEAYNKMINLLDVDPNKVNNPLVGTSQVEPAASDDTGNKEDVVETATETTDEPVVEQPAPPVQEPTQEAIIEEPKPAMSNNSPLPVYRRVQTNSEPMIQ